jgi:hypothetical protein
MILSSTPWLRICVSTAATPRLLLAGLLAVTIGCQLGTNAHTGPLCDVLCRRCWSMSSFSSLTANAAHA